jgi:hypothetical protein
VVGLILAIAIAAASGGGHGKGTVPPTGTTAVAAGSAAPVGAASGAPVGAASTAPVGPGTRAPVSAKGATAAASSAPPAHSAQGAQAAQGAGGAPGAPVAQNVAADRAAATQASLVLQDLPQGWRAQPPGVSDITASLAQQAARCLSSALGRPAAGLPVDVSSPEFDDSERTTVVRSEVGYAPTASAADAQFGLLTGPQMPACLSSAIAAEIAASSPSGGVQHLGSPPTAVRVSFPSVGDESAAYRVSINSAALDSPTVDVVIARRGRADVALAFQWQQAPVPSSEEQHFVGVVLGRLTRT